MVFVNIVVFRAVAPYSPVGGYRIFRRCVLPTTEFDLTLRLIPKLLGLFICLVLLNEMQHDEI